MAEARNKIVGAKELDRALRAMGPRLAERELAGAARVGANVIRKEVRQRAPRSGATPDERRKRSSSGKDYGPLHKNIRVSRRKKTRSSVEFAIHSGQAFWALFLEFGTSKMAARPFFTPALDAKAQQAIDRLGKNLGQRIEKTAKELAGQFKTIRKATRRRL